MKILRYNEKYTEDDFNIINEIDYLIKDEVILKDVPWTEHDQTLDTESTLDAAKRIFNMLINKGINFQLLKNKEKYNI